MNDIPEPREVAALILESSVNPNEHGWPFASGPGRVVTQNHWTTMSRTWQTSGVVGMPETGETPSAGNVGLTAVRASETVVTIQPGTATINGFYYDLKGAKDFALDITGSDYADDGTGRIMRRDLVVLKVDESLSAFRFVQIKNGVNNSSGSWKVVLNDPATEIPLFQVDIEKEVGIDRVLDRRWFLSQSIRPLKLEQPGFEPAPKDGELGVDATTSRLVIGKGGSWVSAREVFTNDIPPELGSRLDGHDTALTDLDGRVDVVENRLNNLNVAIPQSYFYSMAGPLALGVGTFRIYNDTDKTWRITSVRATVGTAPGGASVIIDVNKNGTSIFAGSSEQPTLVPGMTTIRRLSFATSTVAPNEYLTIDIDNVGSAGTTGSDLTVQIVVT